MPASPGGSTDTHTWMEAGQTGAQVGTAAAGFTYKGALKFSGWKARTFPFPERQVSGKASRDEPESMFFHSTDGLGPAHALLVGPQGPAGKGVLLCGCHSCSSPLLTSRVKYSLLVAKNGSLFTCYYEGLHTPPLHVSLSLTLMSRVKASSVGSSQNPLFG